VKGVRVVCIALARQKADSSLHSEWQRARKRSIGCKAECCDTRERMFSFAPSLFCFVLLVVFGVAWSCGRIQPRERGVLLFA
jgi:hypothetical protein